MSSYLQELTIRLSAGMGRLSAECRDLHTQYLLNAQQPDGGFRGRDGESDLYYTSFALRGLAILGQLYGEPAQLAAGFLKLQMQQQQSVVDFFSLFYSASLLKVAAGIDVFDDSSDDWRENVAKFLMSLQREDGGFAKSPEGKLGSTYTTFLVLLVLELVEFPFENGAQVKSFLSAQFVEDGGWREIKVSKQAGTNPTAAAAATFKLLGGMEQQAADLTVGFLLDMQTEEGGLRANTRIPIADLLSSFTGGLTLVDLDGFYELNVDSFRQFVNSLQLPGGGFMAAAWDESHDVEYTFYGLGCLALIENHLAGESDG